jgi:DNA-binding IclR family transcriptional regulator
MSARRDPTTSGGVQVISRVGQLVRTIGAEPAGLTLTDLAHRLELPRSTVHRLVVALAAEGFVTDPSGAGLVRIGPELIRIANTSRLGLRRQIEPIMLRMHDATGETIDCSVLEGDQLRVVEVIPTQHQLRVVAEVGESFPLHCSSKGKAVLSLMSDAQVVDLVPSTLERFTANTITTRTQLLAQLREVRETGLAFDVDEHTLGVSAVAIAAQDPFGTLLALSVPVPSQRFQEERDAIVETLLEARTALADTLGHRTDAAG